MGNSVNTKKIDKKTSNFNKKLVVKDKYKFITFVSVALIFIVGIIVIMLVNAKVKIDNDTNLSKLNANKYKKEMKLQYEKEGKDSEFLEDWNKVQDSVGRYFIENYPSEKEEADKLVDELNDILKGEDWSKITCSKPTMWNGAWSVNENGNVSFKFANKEIEPTSWAQGLSESGYITLN